MDQYSTQPSLFSSTFLVSVHPTYADLTFVNPQPSDHPTSTEYYYYGVWNNLPSHIKSSITLALYSNPNLILIILINYITSDFDVERLQGHGKLFA
jgi:hypothetical protein